MEQVFAVERTNEHNLTTCQNGEMTRQGRPDGQAMTNDGTPDTRSTTHKRGAKLYAFANIRDARSQRRQDAP